MHSNLLKLSITMILSTLILIGCAQKNEDNMNTQNPGEKKVTKRVGMVIGIKPEAIEEYKKLHADSNPGVRDLLKNANFQNFSIFIHQFDDGKYYLFGYYEYTGDNFEKDMAELDKEPRNIEWLKVCDPMQIPFEGQKSWSEMEQVYYLK